MDDIIERELLPDLNDNNEDPDRMTCGINCSICAIKKLCVFKSLFYPIAI